MKPPRDLAETSAARSVSLKTESHLLGDHLREMLQARMEVCGIKIVSFELSDLAYAAEVAPMMLARQQAVALVDARATIVDGAVRIVDPARRRRLAELGHAASAGDRARLATNMMTVLAGETRPQPTISLSRRGVPALAVARGSEDERNERNGDVFYRRVFYRRKVPNARYRGHDAYRPLPRERLRVAPLADATGGVFKKRLRPSSLFPRRRPGPRVARSGSARVFPRFRLFSAFSLFS